MKRFVFIAVCGVIYASLLASPQVRALSPTLVLSPSPGIGVQALPGLWGLRLEANTITDANGITGLSVEVDRPFPLRVKWIPASEWDLGLRYSTTDQAQILAALRRRFDLAQDLHFDLKVGVCLPGMVFVGAKVVQDWF